MDTKIGQTMQNLERFIDGATVTLINEFKKDLPREISNELEPQIADTLAYARSPENKDIYVDVLNNTLTMITSSVEAYKEQTP